MFLISSDILLFQMQNGEDNTVHTDEYNYLVEYGIAKNVAAELEKIYATGNEHYC